MAKKLRKVRFDAYRDIRRAEADARQKANGRITLAGTKKQTPVLKGLKRSHAIDRVISVMRDWRHSPFEFEGAARAGIRSALCLSGHSWNRSDYQAADLVSEALRRMGAQRPSYDQGQREYVERDGVCIWCMGEIDASDSAYGRTGKFCSTECAKAMRFHRAEEWDQRTSAINRAAAAVIAREKIKPLPCLHCGTMFRPINMDMRGRKFCSHECAGAFRRVLPPRDCDFCGKEFQPQSRSTAYCSYECAGKARRTLHPRLCENPACASLFRPRKQEQKYCCTSCHEATGPEAKHPRECLWCQKHFMGKHPTSKFCSKNCKSMEYQCRSGRKPPKTIRPTFLDYLFRTQGLRITGEVRVAA